MILHGREMNLYNILSNVIRLLTILTNYFAHHSNRCAQINATTVLIDHFQLGNIFIIVSKTEKLEVELSSYSVHLSHFRLMSP